MLASFSDLTGMEKFFAGCALLGGICFVIRLVLQFVGGGDTDADGGGGFDAHDGGFDAHGGADGGFDADSGAEVAHGGMEAHATHLDHGEMSFRTLSFQGLTAFFMMFGIVGLALLRESGWGETRATLGGLAAGVGSVWVIKRIFEAAGKLQSSGNVRLENAVGQLGQVYLRIPADGSGQVQVTVQEQMRICDAVSEDGREIATGEAVEVVGISGRILKVRRNVTAKTREVTK